MNDTQTAEARYNQLYHQLLQDRQTRKARYNHPRRSAQYQQTHDAQHTPIAQAIRAQLAQELNKRNLGLAVKLRNDHQDAIAIHDHISHKTIGVHLIANQIHYSEKRPTLIGDITDPNTIPRTAQLIAHIVTQHRMTR